MAPPCFVQPACAVALVSLGAHSGPRGGFLLEEDTRPSVLDVGRSLVLAARRARGASVDPATWAAFLAVGDWR
ncbi:MAG: hypothetical protein MUC56_15975 [Thermoanaerobaculales bacterium]|nr:hypothetical protein [Thermoanaerobaculales bacterium]